MGEVTVMRPAQPVSYTPKQLDLIRRTVAADCDPTEFDLFLEVARRTGLDVFRKQIYAVVYNKKDPEKRKMSIITGIDGYRAIAARNHDYRPDEDPPTFEYDESLKGSTNPAGLVSATVRCWKLAPNGEWHKVAGIAFWDEFVPLTEQWAFDKEMGKRQPTGVYELSKGSNWGKMPRQMLSKTAEALALRRGWPEDLSGLYTEDEMAALYASDKSATEAIEEFERDKRLELTNTKNSILAQWAPDQPLEAVPIGQFADPAARFAAKCTCLPHLGGWEETNRVALNEFWAKAKADALGLKKILEARKAQIAEANKEA